MAASAATAVHPDTAAVLAAFCAGVISFTSSSISGVGVGCMGPGICIGPTKSGRLVGRGEIDGLGDVDGFGAAVFVGCIVFDGFAVDVGRLVLDGLTVAAGLAVARAVAAGRAVEDCGCDVGLVSVTVSFTDKLKSVDLSCIFLK